MGFMGGGVVDVIGFNGFFGKEKWKVLVVDLLDVFENIVIGSCCFFSFFVGIFFLGVFNCFFLSLICLFFLLGVFFLEFLVNRRFLGGVLIVIWLVEGWGFLELGVLLMVRWFLFVRFLGRLLDILIFCFFGFSFLFLFFGVCNVLDCGCISGVKIDWLFEFCFVKVIIFFFGVVLVGLFFLVLFIGLIIIIFWCVFCESKLYV